MSSNIGPKIGVDGEKEFKQQINECNNSLKTMGTEMAKVTSAFIGNEKSVEALTAENKQLESIFEGLSKKAAIQRERLEELDKAGVDPTSAAYQKLVQDLNKTETEMNKTSAKISENSKRLENNGMTAEEAAKAHKKASEKSEEAHKRHAEAAKKAATAIAGVTAAVAGVAAGLVKMTLGAAEAADELSTLSVKTGISTDELQKLQYAAGTVDVSVETVAGAMGKLTKNMASAAGGSKSASDAFAKLGVSVTNSDGSFRDRNQVFNEAIAALGQMTDETERDAAAMAIFGKSAMELNPLIEGGAEALAEMGAHAEEVGLILSGDALEGLSTLADRFDVLKQTISLAGQNFLAQFAEPLTEAIDLVISYVERLVKAFKEGGFKGLATEVSAVMKDLTAKFIEVLPDIAEFATQLILTLIEGMVTMIPALIEAAVQIVTSFVTGIADMLPELIPVAVDAILTIVDTLTNPDNIGALVDASIAIMLALANGLIEALPKLIEKAPVIIQNLVTAIVQNVPKLLEAAFEVIKTLASGIVENLPKIGTAAGEIITTLVEGVAALATNVWNIGKDIIYGIWDGIAGTADWLWNQVKGFFGNLLSEIKEFLGIHSPSTVFANVIGKNMALGIGEGFDNAMDGVERDMMSSIPIPSVDATINGGGAVMGGFGSGIVEEITIPVSVGDVELARVLYRHIVGEGQRIGAAMVT